MNAADEELTIKRNNPATCRGIHIV
jgi:hypothetical protein